MSCVCCVWCFSCFSCNFFVLYIHVCVCVYVLHSTFMHTFFIYCTYITEGVLEGHKAQYWWRWTLGRRDPWARPWKNQQVMTPTHQHRICMYVCIQENRYEWKSWSSKHVCSYACVSVWDVVYERALSVVSPRRGHVWANTTYDFFFLHHTHTQKIEIK